MPSCKWVHVVYGKRIWAVFGVLGNHVYLGLENGPLGLDTNGLDLKNKNKCVKVHT